MAKNLHIIKKYQLHLIQIFTSLIHSWERGLNEHTNGLIRQYLPKKSEFLNVSKDEIIMIENRLNHRPRKILNYKTPCEVFFSEMSS